MLLWGCLCIHKADVRLVRGYLRGGELLAYWLDGMDEMGGNGKAWLAELLLLAGFGADEQGSLVPPVVECVAFRHMGTKYIFL